MQLQSWESQKLGWESWKPGWEVQAEIELEFEPDERRWDSGFAALH